MRRRLQRRGWIPAFQRSSRLPDWTAGTLRFRMETPQWPLANRQQSRRLELGQRRRSDSLARPCSTGDGLRFIHSSSSCGRIGFNVLSVLLHTKTGTCRVALVGSASIQSLQLSCVAALSGYQGQKRQRPEKTRLAQGTGSSDAQ